MKKIVLFLILTAIVLFSLLMLGAYLLQVRLIFHAEPLPADHEFSFKHSFEELFFNTREDTRIHGLKFHAENAEGVVLYFHGNSGTLDDWGHISPLFTKRNFDLVIIDYPGFGKSTGKLTENGLHQDARHIYDTLRETYRPEQIRIFGRSIGTGIAVKLASEVDCGALLLETPYFSLEQLVRSYSKNMPIGKFLRFRFDSNQYIDRVKAPIHIVHGTVDAIVPYNSGRMLYEVAGDNATFYTIEGGTHNDLALSPEYLPFINAGLDFKNH